jgi:hypothetical protein
LSDFLIESWPKKDEGMKVREKEIIFSWKDTVNAG